MADNHLAVLLIQLGTPDAPTPRAVRRYLRDFLSNPRIIEAPRLLWWFILNCFVLTTRPAQSAAKYQRIWDPVTGSPLLHYTRRQAEALQAELPGVRVRFGMQLGQPALADVVRELIAEGVDRFLAFPLYPQYSATTTAAALDCLFTALMAERKVPTLRVVPPYFEHPGYIESVAASIEAELARLEWRPDHYVISFHGIPEDYVRRGDPYPRHVEATTRLLVRRLGWADGTWTQSYQSIFGKAIWLQPYTEEVVRALPGRGVRRVVIVAPGFAADCLETIDELGREVAEVFHEAGGTHFHLCPCLNDSAPWIRAMANIVRTETKGWIDS
jgi:ferrochelatase